MTPQQYAEDLLPLAMLLIGAVHDEGPQAVNDALTAIWALPAPDGINPADAIAVILAAATRPDATRHNLWGWTATLHTGPTDLIPTTPGVNPLAVEMGITGRLTWNGLTDPERTHVVDTLHRRDWPADAIAAHLDTTPTEIRRVRHNSRRRRARDQEPAA